MTMKLKQVQLIVALTVILAAVALYGLATSMNPAPMSGYVTDMEHRPEYFPANEFTPWVYVINITDTYGQKGCSWVVDEKTYLSYSLGDRVTGGWR